MYNKSLMKHILITDPCYIIKDKEWDELCNRHLGEDAQEGDFEQALSKRLQEISGDKKAIVGNTGFGDWDNMIDGQSFYADSGLVCVVEETKALRNYIGGEPYPLGGVARIKVPESAFYELNFMNPRWTKVIIWDGFDKKIAESLDEPNF